MSQPTFAKDTVSSIVAAGSVTTAGSAITAQPSAVMNKQRGVGAAAVTRTSAGLYVLTLPADSVVSFTEAVINCSFLGAAALDFTWHIVSWTALGVITIQWNVAAVATDVGDFSYVVTRIGST